MKPASAISWLVPSGQITALFCLRLVFVGTIGVGGAGGGGRVIISFIEFVLQYLRRLSDILSAVNSFPSAAAGKFT